MSKYCPARVGTRLQILRPCVNPSGHSQLPVTQHEGRDRKCCTQKLDRQLTAATVLPLTVLFTDTRVTVTPILIRGTLEVSAQPPVGFSLAVSPEAVLWLLVWPCFSGCLQIDI